MKVTESKFSKCFYFSSAAFARKVEQMAAQCWEPLSLAPAYGYVLMLVIDNPGIQPGELGRELQLKPSTITRFIEKLESRKWVIRHSMGKITHVYATPEGKNMYPRLKECMEDFYSRYSQLIGTDTVSSFIQQMNSISDKI